MRLFFQAIFIAAVAALLAAGFRQGWWARIANYPPAGQNVWQQGLWPVQDQIAAEIGARAKDAGATPARPLRIAVRMDTSAVPEWRFAPWRNADLERMLTRSDAAAGAIAIVSPDAVPAPALTVTLILQAYVRGPETDELAGVAQYAAGAERRESAFQAVCPAHGRNWFVQPARRLPGWGLLAALAVLLAGGSLGIWAAWQTFTGQFDRSLGMNICAVLVLTAFLALMLTDLAPPGYGQFGIPRWSVRIILDTSDAVRFPLADTAQRPDQSGAAGAPALNDVCRFVEQSVQRIAQAVNAGSAPTRAGFKTWLRHAWENLGRARLRSGLLRASEGVRIFHGLPPAGVSAPPAGAGATVVTDALREAGAGPGPSGPVALKDLPDLLRAGQRGQAPGFFLPWSGVAPGAENELIVAFWTGEPASLRQADWLAQEHARLRAAKPAGLRVLSVLLPALPRSAHPGWSAAGRFRHVGAVSDVLLATQALADEERAPADVAAAVERMAVFPAPAAAPTNAAGGVEQDLDAARTRQLRADAGRMRAAAARIAERVRGLSDVRESSTFQSAPAALILGLCAAAGLLLFLRLQREIRMLDRRQPAGNLEWLGALCGAGLGLGTALLICYMTAEPMRWRTLAGVGLALWGVALLWYAAVWLPLMIGRSLGVLPAPDKMLRVRHLAGWFVAAVAAAGLSAGASLWLSLRDGAAGPAWVATLGMGLTAAVFLALALRYQWVCFWRRSRRRTWGLGAAGLALLIGLPVWGVFGRDAGSWTPWVWAGVILGAAALPAAGALSARRKWGSRGARTVLGLGWSGLIYGLLIGILAPLLLLWPLPN